MMRGKPGVPVYTVGQISSYIRKLFAGDFLLRSLCVSGEVSNLKYHTSGHIYFTLKDATGAINAVMFAGDRRGLGFVLRDGQQVRVTGSISVYERDGRYQLYAKMIEQAGIGDLYKEYLQRKKKLEEMGLFDASYKKPIPPFAFRIGIVTAPTGAAIRDIVNIASRRNPYVQLILYPAIVQGEHAAASLVRGIETLDAMKLDCLIVGRGGGSIEDLWAFNEEAVARAIFDCETPVISAVGHETDTTIADYVADLRAPTPSAAAEQAVFDLRGFLRQLAACRQRLDASLDKTLRHERLLLENYRHRLERHSPQSYLNEKRQVLLHARERLDERMEKLLSAHERQLQLSEDRLRYAFEGQLEDARRGLQLHAAKLQALSPLTRLSGGYAFAESEGKALGSVLDARPGEALNLYLRDGRIISEIKEIVPDDRYK